jgi:hypothetical protein
VYRFLTLLLRQSEKGMLWPRRSEKSVIMESRFETSPADILLLHVLLKVLHIESPLSNMWERKLYSVRNKCNLWNIFSFSFWVLGRGRFLAYEGKYVLKRRYMSCIQIYGVRQQPTELQKSMHFYYTSFIIAYFFTLLCIHLFNISCPIKVWGYDEWLSNLVFLCNIVLWETCHIYVGSFLVSLANV